MMSEHVPYYSEIVPDGEVVIESIFQFKGGCEELMPFLYACESLHCAVTFQNEGIYVSKNGTDDIQDFELSVYASLAKSPKICMDYIKYLGEAMLGHYQTDQPGFVKDS